MEFQEAAIEEPSVIERVIERVLVLYGVAARSPKHFERSLPPGPTVTPEMAERFLVEWRKEQETRTAPGLRRERVRSFDGTLIETYAAGPAGARGGRRSCSSTRSGWTSCSCGR